VPAATAIAHRPDFFGKHTGPAIARCDIDKLISIEFISDIMLNIIAIRPEHRYCLVQTIKAFEITLFL
jgi:hypothetical protein